MENQPQPQNAPVPSERPTGSGLENNARPAMEQAPGLEAAPAPAQAPSGTPAPVPQPKLTADDVAAAIAAVPAPGPALPAPSLAEDVDVIEPEWVAKAESVVAAHQGDPYGEEEAIEQLQQDYLQKRYGHNVADPDKGSKEA